MPFPLSLSHRIGAGLAAIALLVLSALAGRAAEAQGRDVPSASPSSREDRLMSRIAAEGSRDATGVASAREGGLLDRRLQGRLELAGHGVERGGELA